TCPAGRSPPASRPRSSGAPRPCRATAQERPKTVSRAQQPLTWGPGPRRWPSRSASVQPASSRASASTARQGRLTRRFLLFHGPGGVEPADGFGHRPVEVVDEGEDLGLEVRKRGEAGAAQQLAHQDAKPDLYLVQPRAVPGRVDEADPLA